MARLFFGMNQSLDGYVDHHDRMTPPSPKLFPHFVDQTNGLAGSLYGRHLYGIMSYWDQDQPAAELLEKALRLGHEFSRGVMRSQSSDWTPASRKALQIRLKNANVYDGPIDGSFGPATQTAIDRIFDRPK